MIPAKRLEPFLPPSLFGRRYLLPAALDLLRNNGWAKLQRNAKFRGLHRGERCFIIGNGPSLKSMDLTRLRNERIFTSNSFIEYEARFGLSSYVFCAIDPLYFDPQFDDYRLLRFIQNKRAADTQFFFPLNAEKVTQQFVPGANFLLLHGDLKFNANSNICRPLPYLQTVTLSTILIALYMGFEKIYLIGCDMDMLSHVVGVAPLTIIGNHFYEDNHEEMRKELSTFDYGTYCMAIRTMFEGYREIGSRVPPGQEILNAGVGGLLDIFKRVSYESLF